MSGGRWKPLQYILEAAAFADVTASCGQDAICYARNDLPTNQSVRVTVELLKFATGESNTVASLNIDLVAGAGTTVFFCADGNAESQSLLQPNLQTSAADGTAGAGGGGARYQAPCTPFATILNASGCEHAGRDCILNVTVQAATFTPVPPPPFPVPSPPGPPPPPPPPCPSITVESNCTQARCKWVAGRCINPPGPPPPPPPLPPAPPAHDCKFVNGTDYHAGLVVVKHDTPDQYSCCGACDQYKGCVTTVFVFGGCYLFDKRAINQSYSRPGHGVSCQTKSYPTASTTSTTAPASTAVTNTGVSAGGMITNANADYGRVVVLGKVLARNVLPLTAPGQFQLPVATVAIDAVGADGTITLSSTATAVYVWLSTLAHGRFSENGIVLLSGKTTVRFVPFGDLDVATLKSSLRVEHLQQHLSA